MIGACPHLMSPSASSTQKRYLTWNRVWPGMPGVDLLAELPNDQGRLLEGGEWRLTPGEGNRLKLTAIAAGKLTNVCIGEAANELQREGLRLQAGNQSIDVSGRDLQPVIFVPAGEDVFHTVPAQADPAAGEEARFRGAKDRVGPRCGGIASADLDLK